MSSAWCGGLDLGQSADWTALALCERDGAAYRLRQLDRTRGLPYVGTPSAPGVVEKLAAFFRAHPPLRGCHLAVDRTGVGRAVVDALRAAGLPCALWAVTVTGGQEARQDGLDLYVPKKDLVGVAQALLGSGRLLIEPALPLADTLRRELADFRARITAAGNETYEAWREGAHDDLVFAVSLACWLGERFPPFSARDIGTSSSRRGGVEQRQRSPFGASRDRDRWRRG